MDLKALQNGLFIVHLFTIAGMANGQTVMSNGERAELAIRPSGEHSLRITLRPLSFQRPLPYSPALISREWPEPDIKLQEIPGLMERQVGSFRITISSDPLTVVVKNRDGDLVTDLVFYSNNSGYVSFGLDGKTVLGMGEGGPRMGENWRDEPLEFDRRGRFHDMAPRWQAQAYGSRNPVPFLIGTGGWALFVATPWVHVDLSNEDRGKFIPWKPPVIEDERRRERALQGRPPVSKITPGVFDIFVFDASRPESLMKEISLLTGKAVMPPKWSLGYMQSHRTLEDEAQMLGIVDTFRAKQIPIDAVIYLGTGFCPRGWNTEQPSVTFNPQVFKRDPREVIADLQDRNVKVVVHIVPWESDTLPTLHGNIPSGPEETVDKSHIQTYWNDHLGLIDVGIDAFWPDEGDRFNLFERMSRHKMYYQGPLSSRPNVRPWSLHRNGHLGVARWGGWIWSGDPNSAWQTLRGQIGVGQNHSLSLSPFWGSDIGGFYPSEELTGELYARWFQFGAFCPSFRAHGRTWWMRLPWGWGLGEMGPLENRNNPLPSELNNPKIEPICRKYAELRQYTAQVVKDPTTLKVYRGADGDFTLYEDDGISLDYLQGNATWTRLVWKDASRRLTIEPGAPATDSNLASDRTFIVELLPDGIKRSVRYTGNRIEVIF